MAARLLSLLAHVDGVAYIEAGGVKKILLRGGGATLDLERCDLPKERRFTFYDQVSMGRYTEICGAMGRAAERCGDLLRSAETRGDKGSYGEIWGDKACG